MAPDVKKREDAVDVLVAIERRRSNPSAKAVWTARRAKSGDTNRVLCGFVVGGKYDCHEALAFWIDPSEASEDEDEPGLPPVVVDLRHDPRLVHPAPVDRLSVMPGMARDTTDPHLWRWTGYARRQGRKARARPAESHLTRWFARHPDEMQWIADRGALIAQPGDMVECWDRHLFPVHGLTSDTTSVCPCQVCWVTLMVPGLPPAVTGTAMARAMVKPVMIPRRRIVRVLLGLCTKADHL